MVNGRVVGSSNGPAPTVQPDGRLFVGCGVGPNGTFNRCFNGEFGELRVYPEYWPTPPRVTGIETELSLPRCDFDSASCPHHFGQPLVVRRANDLAKPDDDVATEYKYAVPDRLLGGQYRLYGLVSSEATFDPKTDGSPDEYLSFSAHWYDGKPHGQATVGNESQLAHFDGVAQPLEPTINSLRVKTRTAYALDCPGRPAEVTDPLEFATKTTWDSTCTFPLTVTNALGHTSRMRYYGVADLLAPLATRRDGAHGAFHLGGRYGQVATAIDPNGATTLSTYDEWGRPVATWSPLDRDDRPGLRIEYGDAVCTRKETSGVVVAPCNLQDSTLRLAAPALVSTLTWDDLLRRCKDAGGKTVQCSEPSARTFADESSTGAYRVSHAFGDGQIQAQAVNDGKPAWTVTGITDFDKLGRVNRTYKIQYLPSLNANNEGPCPGPGQWCDSQRPGGIVNGVDQLRQVATIQTAYDARNRVIRTYGPSWPRCDGDPSEPKIVNGQPSSELKCDTPAQLPVVNDVTKFEYPAPGNIVTIDANKVPTLVRRDARGLLTLFQEYMLSAARPGATPTPIPYSTVSSTYDRLGRLVSTKDQHGNTSINTYDAMSRLRSSTDPDLGLMTYEYDLRSQLKERIVASGEKTIHEYDKIGRVTQTDYLRPKLVSNPGSGFPGTRPTEGGEEWAPPEFCYDVPGFSEPSRITPSSGPIAHVPLNALALVEGDLSKGAAILQLPFNLSILTTEAMQSASVEQPSLRFVQKKFEFQAGSSLIVSTHGSVRFGGEGPIQALSARSASPRPSAHGILNVLSTDLLLKERGLRSAVVGEDGARSLIVEWEGSLPGRPNEPLLVRLTLLEGASGIRYDYISVPRDIVAEVGLQFESGDSQFSRSIGQTAGEQGAPIFASGMGFSFGEDTGRPGLRITCSSVPVGGIAIPIKAGGTRNPQLQLRYRIFSDCHEGSSAKCGIGNVRVGYREFADSNSMQPLMLARSTRRPINQSDYLDYAVADALDVILPDSLHGKDFTLVVEPDFGTIGAKHNFLFDLVRADVVTTIYEPEERVHRTYDSSEPPYYIDSRSGRQEFETKPVLDLTFDVPGVVADRSPTNTSFASPTCDFARLLLNSVQGISGRGLRIPASFECVANVSVQAPISKITAELWVRPQSRPLTQQKILSVDGMFSIEVFPDTGGNPRVRCASGQGTTAVISNVILPTDAWSHVAVAFDGAQMQCSINGVQQGQQPASIVVAPTFAMRLGDPLNLQARPISIDIDEVRVMADARTQVEILEDALRPLNVGAPRGNLVHIDFSQPSNPGSDSSRAGRNNAGLVRGQIIPGIQGMAFHTRSGATGSADAEVKIPHSPRLRLEDAVTAELWLKREPWKPGQSEQVRLIGKWQDQTHPGWRLELDATSGRLRWEVVTESLDKNGLTAARNEVFVAYETIPTNEWHHVAATYDGERLRVFKDGLPAHRWCWSGPQEGAMPVGGICNQPPPPTACAVETFNVEVPVTVIGGKSTRPLGDAVCIRGVIDNTTDVLIAYDGAAANFEGMIDEVRISNYAKREFEIAASARLAAEYSKSLGRETILRNRFIWRDGQQVGPLANEAPYDLAQQPAREMRAYDLKGALASAVKHVLDQKSPKDHFLARTATDSRGRSGLLEYPHGEVVVSGFGLDGTQTSLIGYGPFINFQQPAAQSQTYISDAASTITGQPATVTYGNGVATEWTHDDAPVPGGMLSSPTGAFGPDSLKTVKVKTGGRALSDRTYKWDAVGNLVSVGDAAFNRIFRTDYAYDDLRRVTSATHWGPGSLALGLSYCYDALGNLILIDGTARPSCYDAQGKPILKRMDASSVLRVDEGGLQEYGRALFPPACPSGSNVLPHALTQRTSLLSGQTTPTARTGAYCYDASGKLIWSIDPRGDRAYTYFARGKPSSITSGGLKSEYLYDGNGVRISKREQGRDTQIIPGPAYREIFDPLATPSTPAALPRFEAIYSGIARRVLQRPAPPATMPSDELVWFSNDHLGGTYFLTDPQGGEAAGSRAYYRPFGGYLQAPPQAEEKSGYRQFTSKERDVTGLYDFSARLYDPTIGRFTQGDDVNVGSNPQAINRYSYVLNNPLMLIDPSGHQAQIAEMSSDSRWTTVEDGYGTVRQAIPNFDDGIVPRDLSRYSLLNEPDGAIPETWQKAWDHGWEAYDDPFYRTYLEEYRDSGWTYEQYRASVSGAVADTISPLDFIGGGALRFAREGSVTLFHGTTRSAAWNIRRLGFRAGGDSAVFFAEEAQTASVFGAEAVAARGASSGTLVVLRVPQSLMVHFERMELGALRGSRGGGAIMDGIGTGYEQVLRGRASLNAINHAIRNGRITMELQRLR